MKHFENIKLYKDKGEHLYIQLYKAIKKLIMEERLSKDEKLPPIRKLAQKLDVNNVTVVNAYHILEQEGLVYKKMGSGTYISPDFLTYISEEVEDQKIIEGLGSLSLIEQGQIQIKNNMINFASATPMAELFPVDDFKEVLNEVLDRDKGHAFDYQESQGYLPLREALIKYVREYNIFADINSLQIISGAQQGIDIIAKALLNYGDTVIVENPSYTGAIASFKSRGAKIIDVNLIDDGIDIDDLERKIRIFRPRFLYLMPNFQNPTGISYSRSKKEKIINLCKQYNMYIVEDDYLSDLNFYSWDNTTLKSLDTNNDLVIYVKSFSKIFMPGLRLGFLIAPSIFYDHLLFAKHSSDISTSGLLQRALELYFTRGTWKEHIKYMEKKYKSGFDTMLRSIEKYMPSQVEYIHPKGGVNFWFKLPMEISSRELYEKAIRKNVALAPGNLFFIHQNDNNHFRLSIASVNNYEIEKGIIIISNIIKELINDINRSGLNEEKYRPIL
ncbi:PLP-dependent aminotransferase family protein [Alkaliphilus sp. MSJ-5]|uniref:PLP-dependent aminotransferase family protein n=1 Tax=Alkaliphilus flagellatus TaxID=2841507 RepID=A0ABS6FZD0_9FIRM|nr:PLP-dependent aminotransferase family protein [Alkaliphilus flagellatus]MBU5675610.1 PLP-dependent aminotransferase family protein [Alkaliphilus flagellatus]